GLFRISAGSTLTARDYRRRRRGLDRGLAVRAHLLQRLERRPALHARLPELRRADRAHEIARVDVRAADGTDEAAPRQPVLHGLDLQLALAHVLEVLRWPEEHVDERAGIRHEPERRREADEPGVVDAPVRVLV